MLKLKAVYIHIPFCEHICYYCDFNKFYLKGQPVDEYLELLLQEMEMTLSEVNHSIEVETIFVGGGTPTVLTEKQLDFLCHGIRKIVPYKQGEFTFEANPGDLSKEKLQVLSQYGVNRLSFGVQTFNEDLLKRIGRTHRVKDVFQSVALAQSLGFENISIDLIYGLPGQTVEDFRDSLIKALELDLPHYSSYSLIVEPKTVFYNLLRQGKLRLPSEEVEVRMYEILMELMENHGKFQYEISNFAERGFESRHNLVYWNNEEYFGFGAGAHGYINGVRYSNRGPLKKYMEPISKGKRPIFTEHVVTEKEKIEEEMFLGLRKNEGVSISRFQEKFHQDPLQVFEEPLHELKERRLIKFEGDFIQLTRKGRFLGNEVFQAFLL